MNKKIANELKNLPAQETAIVLTDSKQLLGTVVKNTAQIYANNAYHKFYVYNVGTYSRDFILGTILKYCQPDDLIPVGYYEYRVANTVFFFAKGCGACIEKLCKDNLVVPNPKDPKYPFKLKITVNYANAAALAPTVREINKNLNTVLFESFDAPLRTLNLSYFHSRTELHEFTPLFIPRILSHILNMSKSQFTNLRSVDLSSNSLTQLESLELLWGSSVQCLNLSNNELTSIAALQPLKHLRLKEFSLDKNPLCQSYDDVTYVQRIRQLFPTLEKLDGVPLNQTAFPMQKKNFICNMDGFDLVEQFLYRYFTMYDCNNRQMLEGFYHKNAVFSMTAVYLPGQVTSVTAQMKDYKMHSRNLVSLVDYSRSDHYYFRGVTSIMKLFAKLPQSEHDLCSFDTDLLSYTSKGAVLVVHGVFREPAKSLLATERFLGFSRNFVFERNNDQFSIVNEQLHVYNAFTNQKSTAFSQDAKPTLEIRLPIPETLKERQQLISAVKLITTMNDEWAEKLLTECHYDLKKTLALFVDLYKVDKIPKEALTSESSKNTAVTTLALPSSYSVSSEEETVALKQSLREEIRQAALNSIHPPGYPSNKRLRTPIQLSDGSSKWMAIKRDETEKDAPSPNVASESGVKNTIIEKSSGNSVTETKAKDPSEPFDEISLGSDDFNERQMELSEISSEGKISQASIGSPRKNIDTIDISSDENLSGKSQNLSTLLEMAQKAPPMFKGPDTTKMRDASSTAAPTRLNQEKAVPESDVPTEGMTGVNNQEKGELVYLVGKNRKRTRIRKKNKKKSALPNLPSVSDMVNVVQPPVQNIQEKLTQTQKTQPHSNKSTSVSQNLIQVQKVQQNVIPIQKAQQNVIPAQNIQPKVMPVQNIQPSTIPVHNVQPATIPVQMLHAQQNMLIAPKNVTCMRCGAPCESQQNCPCFRDSFIDNCKYWLSRLQKHN